MPPVLHFHKHRRLLESSGLLCLSRTSTGSMQVVTIRSLKVIIRDSKWLKVIHRFAVYESNRKHDCNNVLFLPTLRKIKREIYRAMPFQRLLQRLREIRTYFYLAYSCAASIFVGLVLFACRLFEDAWNCRVRQTEE